jgi:hypothetical protein
MAKLDDWKTLKREFSDRLEELKILASEDVAIDEFNLDGEALRTPKLHSKWISILADESVKAKQIFNLQKKLYLERLRYYSGIQTDKYYHEHGVVNVKILKGDLNIYLDADDITAEIREIVEIQSQIVDFLERTVKEISSRTFHIKSAIEWRKFEAGS